MNERAGNEQSKVGSSSRGILGLSSLLRGCCFSGYQYCFSESRGNVCNQGSCWTFSLAGVGSDGEAVVAPLKWRRLVALALYTRVWGHAARWTCPESGAQSQHWVQLNVKGRESTGSGPRSVNTESTWQMLTRCLPPYTQRCVEASIGSSSGMCRMSGESTGQQDPCTHW